MRGITPLITIIMLVMIVISLVGFSYMFFIRVEGAGESAGTGEIESATTYEKFKIENTFNDKLYIRNLGTKDLSNLVFYANDVPVTVTSGCGGSIKSLESCEFDIDGLSTGEEYLIKVVSPKGERRYVTLGPVMGDLILLMEGVVSSVIYFDEGGNALLKGSLTENADSSQLSETVGVNEFLFYDSGGSIVMRIDLDNGGMFISGNLYENQASLSPSSGNDIIVEDGAGAVVSYLAESGDFYLSGNLLKRPVT